MYLLMELFGGNYQFQKNCNSAFEQTSTLFGTGIASLLDIISLDNDKHSFGPQPSSFKCAWLSLNKPEGGLEGMWNWNFENLIFHPYSSKWFHKQIITNLAGFSRQNWEWFPVSWRSSPDLWETEGLHLESHQDWDGFCLPIKYTLCLRKKSNNANKWKTPSVHQEQFRKLGKYNI